MASEQKKGETAFAVSLSMSKNLCLDESARVLAGELEGAAARLEWGQGVQRAQRGLFRR